MNRDFQVWYDRSLHWGVASAQGLAAGPTLFLASALGLKRGVRFFGGQKRCWKWWGFNPYSSIFHESNLGYSIYIYNMCCVTGVNQVVFRHPLRESIFRYAPVVGFVRAVFPGGATTPGRPVPVPYTRHAPVAVANVAPRAQFVRLDEGLSGVNGINGVNGVNVSGVSGRQQQRRCGHRRCAKGEGRTGGTEALGMAWSL